MLFFGWQKIEQFSVHIFSRYLFRFDNSFLLNSTAPRVICVAFIQEQLEAHTHKKC